MYKGLALQDGTVSANNTFGAHVNVGNADEPFALDYYGGSGANNGNWVARKLDPITMKGLGRSARGYALTGRGRTWDFIVRVGQSGG